MIYIFLYVWFYWFIVCVCLCFKRLCSSNSKSTLDHRHISVLVSPQLSQWCHCSCLLSFVTMNKIAAAVFCSHVIRCVFTYKEQQHTSFQYCLCCHLAKPHVAASSGSTFKVALRCTAFDAGWAQQIAPNLRSLGGQIGGVCVGCCSLIWPVFSLRDVPFA